MVPKSECSLELIFCIGKTENMVLPKMEIYWKFQIKNSDFGENLIARGSIYEPFLICVTPSEDPSEVHVFEKC